MSARPVALLAAAALTALTVSCSSGEGASSAGDATRPSASASTLGGSIPRPGCLPAGADFANVPSGADLATPVGLLGERGERGVVLGAQSNGGICQMVPYASEVAALGYRVAVLEWRGDRTASMAAAVRAITTDGATRVVVGGFSEGAVIGLGGASTFGPQVVGVLAVSGGPDREDGYPDIASVSRFAGPLLLVRGKDDTVFPADTEARIAAAHAGTERVVVLEGSEHALALLDGTNGPRVRAEVTDFLAAVLPAG